MNGRRSYFREELAIIPRVAVWLAVLAFVLMQICLLGLAPRYLTDLPPMPWLQVVSVIGGLFLAVIILLIGYVNADSKRRGMNSLLWTLLVIVVPKALGFLAYFLLRTPLLRPCPRCGTPVGADFGYCQECGYALRPFCCHCGRAISPDYVCCPYCGKTVAIQAERT
jgi:Double zinc ribbon